MVEIGLPRRMGESPVGLPDASLFDDGGKADSSACPNVHSKGDRQEQAERLGRTSDRRGRLDGELLPPLAMAAEPVSSPLCGRREVELPISAVLVEQEQFEAGRPP